MNRLAFLIVLFAVLLAAEVARAQYFGGVVTTTYYAPTASYYAPATTAYYAPAPTTVYYAAPTAVYYQRPLVGTGITRVGYAPVTYVVPRAAYYAPVTYATGYRAWW